MNDKQTPQSKPTNSQSTKPIEDSFNASSSAKLNTPNKPGIRPNLMSGQVEATPIISENTFQQSSATGATPLSTLTAKPTAIPGQLKAKRFNSKLIGLGSVLGLLVLASIGLFITYNSYQKSYQKLQQSRVSNNISSTSVDLAGFNTTSTSADTTGLLQVNGDANITNNLTAGSFSGNGADLTNVNAQTLNSQPGSFYQNASNINAGTLGDQFLSPNVALLGANQAFTGSNSFGGSSNFTGAVVLPGTLTINSLTYNMPGSQAAGSLINDGTGNLIWQPGGACPTCVNTPGNSFGAAMSVGTNDNFDLTFRTNGITRLTFDTTGNATFAGTINGNGSGITNLNGSNIASGTVADARLTSNVTLQGNIFNGAFQLVQLGPAGELPVLNGAALTNLDASNISAGTLNDLRLSANVTLQGNTFNVANKLVQLNGTGGLPALNGSLLTALNASNISSGSLADARLSANVALLGANQTFSGTNAFSAGITTNTIATTTGLTVGTTTQSLALQGNGSTTLASNSGGFVTTIGFSGAPIGNVNYNFDAATAAGTYGICTTVGNCASSGGGVTTLGGTTNKVAKFTGLQSIGDGSITDTGTQVTTQSTSTDSASAFRVLNAAGTTTAFNVDTTNTRIGVGTATPSYAVDAVGDINASNGLWVAGNQVCNNTGCIAAASSGFYINNGTGTQATANFNIQSAAAGNIGGVIKGAAAQTANLQEWQNSAGTTLASVSAAGTINTAGQYQVAGVQIASSDLSNNANLAKLDATQSFTGINTFQSAVNSTGAFKIQNAAGSSNLLIADTTNTRIGIGTASPGYTLDVNGDVNISTGSLYRINGVAICGATGTCAPSALSTFYIQNGTGQQASANFNIVSTAIGSITGILQGAVGQTAELLQLRAGDGTIVAGFSNVGVLTLGNDNGTPQAGSIVIHDNTGSNTFTNTIGTAALTASRTITFPDETGTVCTTGSVCTGYAPGTGGAYANQQLSNLSGTVAINLSLTPNADNTLDLGSSAASWRTLYADTSLLTPLLDTATGVALNLGTSTATSVSLGRTGITTTNNGALTVTQLLTGNLGATIGGGAIALTGTAASSFTTSTGTLTLGTSSTADLILRTNSGTNGQLTLSGNLGASVTTLTGLGATTLTSDAAMTINSAAGSALAIGATSTSGAINIGGALTSGMLNLGASGQTNGIAVLGNISGDVTFLQAAAHTISIAQSSAATVVGGALSIVAGQGSNTTSGIGGVLNLTGGAAGTTLGNGGAVAIFGGLAAGVATGGAVGINGGNGVAGGAVNITGGTGITGGNINITTTSNGVMTFGVTATTSVNFTMTATGMTSGTGLKINTPALSSGTAVYINGPSSGSSFTTGKMLRINAFSSGLTTAGANEGSLLDLSATGSPTAFTGSLANISFAGNAVGNTGSLLNINSTGASSLVQSILVTNNSTGAPANGLVRFNFTGAHTNNGFQIDDVSTAGNAMQINANALTSGSALSISATGLTAEATLATNSGAGIKIDVGTTTNTRYMVFTDGVTLQGSITNAAGAAVAYNTSSDARLKENIVDTAYSLDTVLAIKVRDYTFISDPNHTVVNGFVAQELYEIYPGAVTVGNDAVDANGNLLNPWGVDYGKLTPLLAKGIQELNTKVDASAAGLSASVLQTLATANAITINGTLTINGVTIFNGNAKFNGDITVNQDGAGEATIVAGASSVDVVFSQELATIPIVTATPQDFIGGQYKVTNVTKAGFTIITSIAQTADAKFSWTAVQK